MGFETWATFVVAAAALSAYKRRDEIAVTLNDYVALPKQDDQRALFGAWWPCMLTSVVIMLVLTQSYRVGLLSRKVARKAIHFSMGMSYMCFWPSFPEHPWARYCCASVPLASGIVVILVGSGFVREPALHGATSRTGKREELLQGPLIYAVVHVAGTISFWRTSPVALIALAVLCGGDGAAEPVGVAFGRVRLPYNRAKSYAGTAACLAFGWAAAAALALHFSRMGVYDPPLTDGQVVAAATAGAVVGAAAESIISGAYDNIAVFIAAAAGAQLALVY